MTDQSSSVGVALLPKSFDRREDGYGSSNDCSDDNPSRKFSTGIFSGTWFSSYYMLFLFLLE